MDVSANNSIFMNLYRDYKKYIEMGVYKNGDRLPSVRQLASELGINPNTVQRAFKVLEDEGYVQSVNKKGFYVSFNSNENKYKDNIKKQFIMFKNEGIKKEELALILEEVYNDNN